MIAAIIGNGLGVLLLAVGIITMRHLKKEEKEGGRGGYGQREGVRKIINRDTVMRFVIVDMFLAGIGLLATGIGSLARSLFLGLVGLAHSGPVTLLVCTVVFLVFLFEVVIGIWRRPQRLVAWCAPILAFTLTLPLPGEPARVAHALQNAGTAYAAMFGHFLGH